jgi:hypothetical protein
VLADLEERRIGLGLDEVAFRIDVEQPWLFLADLTARPTSLAAWYIELTLPRVASMSVPCSDFMASSRSAITACVTARLPAESRMNTRSPRTSQVCSLRNEAMLSSPALVRVSAAMTRPRLSFRPTQ